MLRSKENQIWNHDLRNCANPITQLSGRSCLNCDINFSSISCKKRKKIQFNSYDPIESIRTKIDSYTTTSSVFASGHAGLKIACRCTAQQLGSLRASWMPSGAGRLSGYAIWFVNILSIGSRHLQMPANIRRYLRIYSNISGKPSDPIIITYLNLCYHDTLVAIALRERSKMILRRYHSARGRTADPVSGGEQQHSLLDKLSKRENNRISWSIKNLVAPEVPSQLYPEKTNFSPNNSYLIATLGLARLAKNFTASHHPSPTPQSLHNAKTWVVPTATLSPLSLGVGVLLLFE